MSNAQDNMDLNDIPELQNMDRDTALTLLDRLDGIRAYLTSFVQADPAPTEDADGKEEAEPEEVASPASADSGTSEHSITSMVEGEIQNLIDGGAGAASTAPSDSTDSNDSPDLTIGTLTSYPKITTDEQKMKALISLQAPLFENLQRAPLDLVVVVDRSMSMEGEPIYLVKETLKFIITQLSSSDRLSVVSYGSDVRTVAELTKMDHNGKEVVGALIDTIRVDGYTNLCGGLVKGVEILRDRPEAGRADVCSVLLLTDGEANRGYTDPSEIMRACVNKNFAAKLPATPAEDVPLGCTINTFGFSDRHNSSVLKQIAEGGRGMFYYIPNTDSIGASFSDCLGGLLSTTAQDIELELTPALGVHIEKIYSKFEIFHNPASQVVKIPDMQSEERREILVDLRVPAGATGTQDLLKVDLKYFNLIRDIICMDDSGIQIERAETVDGVEPDLSVDRANNREIATAAIEEAQTLGSRHEISTAKVVLTSAIEAIGSSYSAGDEFCQGLITELTAIKSELSDRGYSASLECTMTSSTTAHGYQRSAGTNTGAQTAYVTSSRNRVSENCTTYMQAGSGSKSSTTT